MKTAPAKVPAERSERALFPDPLLTPGLRERNRYNGDLTP